MVDQGSSSAPGFDFGDGWEAPPPAPRRVSVLLPLPLPEAYDYKVPAGLDVAPGDYVEVPLGPRHLLGVVWGPGAGEVADGKLRPIAQRFDVPPMPEVQRRFIDWVAAYTMAPPGAVLRMALSAIGGMEPPKPVTAYRLGDPGRLAELRMTPARRRVLDLLADGPPRPPAELALDAGCGVGVVRGLADAGVLEPVLLHPTRDLPLPDWSLPGPHLSGEQAAGAAALRARVAAGAFSATLLDGVTGSGKTEVYFEGIAAALEAGKQVLVLLPEIALSAQWLERFALRFGAPPHQWHSDLSGAQRRATWRDVATGAARVVVGARSALFLPYPELGLILIDEEHDPSFKQEDGVIYNARDMAVARAHLAGIPIVLVSATPSLESAINAEAHRYGRIDLPARHGGASMPEMKLIDLRLDRPPRNRWLAPSLVQALTETFASGEQGMLFLNRRGYAPLTLCRNCGHRLQCPNCTAWLVEHRLAGKLQCHHCDFTVKLLDVCPSCGAEGSLTACGPGVERIAEEVTQLFPDQRTALMTSDSLVGPHAIREMVRRVQDHEIDLLIGTQVMAKGHHFPMLTLVGVVDADLGLGGGDLRAAERTYQLLQQVAGRAGRAERPGRVFLQTYMPEHPVLQALVSGDRDSFYEREAEERHIHAMPPFGRLAALIVSGEEEGAVEAVARALGRTAPRSETVQVLGPAPAPYALLRGRHRRRLLLKAPRAVSVQPLIADWLARVEVPGTVRVQVDIDPYSFL
ncbi:primosomal protein N' [Skermanella sp. TT6]|uniref:Replication restart protein PriA n=1 Tax=Skermanella cutis TaxID=2775420 RepID=A0ABX7B6D4_9PROT|nr:primosomal protein N' [Skermanella sp. TT6]QQP88938.1 primosomal protein N' [Skermanella sp. TT6]